MERPKRLAKSSAPSEALTAQEQQKRLEDMVLRRAERILAKRAADEKARKPVPPLKPRRFARCHDCKAWKLLEKK